METLPLHDDAVGGDLVAVRKPHEVVGDELGGAQRPLARGADDGDLLLREDGEPVHHALGADLLDDADDEVRPHDAHEEEVAVLPP